MGALATEPHRGSRRGHAHPPEATEVIRQKARDVIHPAIEVISRDPVLVASVERVVAATAHPVNVVSDPAHIERVLGGRAAAPRVIDLAAVRVAGPSLALGVRRGDELVLVVPAADRASIRLEVYARSALVPLLHDLARLLPRSEAGAGLLLGDDPAIRAVRRQIGHVALYPEVSVLILGETGTGKEIAARAIHQETGATGELVAVNCAAIPGELLEAELFGHEAGSYTDARTSRAGLFESAGEGTLFLDEIGEMPAPLQTKLLRVLESRAYRRVGSNREQPLRARIVSATNRDLVGRGPGSLRTDLLYRLAGFTIELPPLRARVGDIELLARSFLDEFARRHGSVAPRLSREASARLRHHSWPGNVRELRSAMGRLAISASGPVVSGDEVDLALRSLPSWSSSEETTADASGERETPPGEGGDELEPLREVERRMFEQALRREGGNLTRAALALGIPRSTFRDKLRRLGLAAADVPGRDPVPT